MFFSVMKRHHRCYSSRSFYSSSATATLLLLFVCKNNYNDNNNNNIDDKNNDNNNNNKIENKFELFKSIVPYAYCSTLIPSSMNNIKTKKYDHNNNNVNNDNNNNNNNTYVKDDVINLIEDDINRRIGYNYNNQSSYASYPANDPCEDRIAIINKPSYRIGKKPRSV